MEIKKPTTDEKSSAKKKVGAKGSAQGRNKLKCQRYRAKGLHERRKAARILRYLTTQRGALTDIASINALRKLQETYPLTLKSLAPAILAVERHHEAAMKRRRAMSGGGGMHVQ